MKIFSNFDTNWRAEALEEARERFGEENILLLRKSKLFLVSKVILPITSWTLFIGALQFPIYLELESFWSIRYWLIIVMFTVYYFIIAQNIKYLIDYLMDFSVVTPEYLTRYNQTGFFKRDIKTSNARNIKTVSIQKWLFWYNIFDNWDLIFLSEWDKANQWEIILHYIADPEAKKKEINRIMRMNNLTH